MPSSPPWRLRSMHKFHNPIPVKILHDLKRNSVLSSRHGRSAIGDREELLQEIPGLLSFNQPHWSDNLAEQAFVISDCLKLAKRVFVISICTRCMGGSGIQVTGCPACSPVKKYHALVWLLGSRAAIVNLASNQTAMIGYFYDLTPAQQAKPHEATCSS